MNQFAARLWASLLALSLLLSLAACGGRDATATAMHLTRTEGTVAVSDGGGKDVPVLDNLGLYSGYGVNTRPASYAWINLDDVKLVKLDQNSGITIQKEEKRLEIELKSGSLFFNVTQPLEEDETMGIRTSTMLVGIRGTCGWVEERSGLSRVYILEGKVECSAGGKTVQVNAGEMGALTAGGELTVEPFTAEDIPAFVRVDTDPGLIGGLEGTAEPSQGPAPGTTPAPSAGGSQTAGAPEVTVTATGIRADGVVNYDGYGRLRIDSAWSEYWDEDWNEHEERAVRAQLALIDRNGSFMLPYQEDTVGNFYTGDADMIYSDGIVSLSLGSAHSYGGIPQYFNLDGTPAFVLEETEEEYTDENGVNRHTQTSYLGGPMKDGYAVVIQKSYSSWWGGMAGGADGYGDNRTLIIDRNGRVAYELPEEFNETLAAGAGGFDTKMSLGWCGEGLFAFFENSYDYEDWTYTSECKGYMDHTGKTVIDLEGRGFRNLGPFTNGLAWVVDETGKVGFIDKTGALVIPCIYESTGSFSSDGLTYAKMDGKWGYIDKAGKTVIPFEYDAAYGAGNGLAAVVKDGKCGLVDYSNNVAVPLEYDDVSSFEGGAAYGIKDGLVYIIT